MVVVRTELRDTREAAKRLRFEPNNRISATNVQDAITGLVNVGTARLPAAAASVNILNSDVEVGIDTAASAVSVQLPSVAAWASLNTTGLELTIFDLTGHATAHNITPVLFGSDSFVQGTTPIITGNFGLMKLRPVIGAANQWYVRGLN